MIEALIEFYIRFRDLHYVKPFSPNVQIDYKDRVLIILK